MGIYDVPRGSGDGVGGFKCLGPWEEPELVLGEGRTGIRVIETLIEPQTRVPQSCSSDLLMQSFCCYCCVCVWGGGSGDQT